jgi:hypothetical protein
MKDWGCNSHFSVKNSGSALHRCCRNYAVEGGAGSVTAKCSKASSGCSRPVRAGEICPRSIPLAAPAGGVCGCGKSAECGLKSGAPFCANSTREDGWTGARAFWTGVLLPLKRGRRCRQNQARQGHEVDGGGRRPRCSSGKSAYLGKSRRSKAGRIDSGKNRGASRRPWSSATTAIAGDCRPGLRQRSAALATALSRHSLDLSSSQTSSQTAFARWTLSAPLPQTLEDRTHFCLARQLPSPGSSAMKIIC